VIKLLHDIFALNFDIVIPVSSCLLAIAAAMVLFFTRYLSYRHNKSKYEKLARKATKHA